MDLRKRLIGMAKAEGADFFGLADLSQARTAITAQGGEIVASYPVAISIGMRMNDDIVDLLPRQEERWVRVSYRHECYDVLNARLEALASRIASEIQREGYRSFPVPASRRVDDERICAVFSHKLAAHLAGLGWIGKSCLLVTPEVGPRVRWTTVLTDAPLSPTARPMKQRCGDCYKCVDACPVKAFTGRNFVEEEPREVRFDARKCERHYDELERTMEPAVCGMCVHVCPNGQKGKTLR